MHSQNPSRSTPLSLISICLPCLNATPFLQERLDSIFAQTHTNRELNVADSFSTDSTWSLLLERLGGFISKGTPGFCEGASRESAME